ncbi:hypothetical protein NEOC95_000176 [Neochlamydia sp. AcF95]|nr:hypothetical protein [Neochlamydia sp. AcF95]
MKELSSIGGYYRESGSILFAFIEGYLATEIKNRRAQAHFN